MNTKKELMKAILQAALENIDYDEEREVFVKKKSVRKHKIPMLARLGPKDKKSSKRGTRKYISPPDHVSNGSVAQRRIAKPVPKKDTAALDCSREELDAELDKLAEERKTIRKKDQGTMREIESDLKELKLERGSLGEDAAMDIAD